MKILHIDFVHETENDWRVTSLRLLVCISGPVHAEAIKFYVIGSVLCNCLFSLDRRWRTRCLQVYVQVLFTYDAMLQRSVSLCLLESIEVTLHNSLLPPWKISSHEERIFKMILFTKEINSGRHAIGAVCDVFPCLNLSDGTIHSAVMKVNTASIGQIKGEECQPTVVSESKVLRELVVAAAGL